ncbi:5'/3'-nucleotidase SurE [Candidatus Parcubacteria bacterium]|nr:MAG: 5'/3'-nucleotidase SurE [Candidatus Parcubacteria bacterium]
MLILITNDDGIDAPGLHALAEAFSGDHEVWVVAPKEEQSGSSHSLTMMRPLRAIPAGERRFKVDGTPSDAVYIALASLLPRKPDLLLSGINRGGNMGEDVTYSGTVAGAIEGTIQGVPSVAVSVVGLRGFHYDAACVAAKRVVSAVMNFGLPQGVLLNVNVPQNLAPENVKLRLADLGHRDYRQSVVRREDPRGVPYYWLGGNPLATEPREGSDVTIVENGCVAVTPIRIDMTDRQMLSAMAQWGLEK